MDDQAFPRVAQQQQAPKRPKTLLILALFLMLLGGVLFVGSRLLGTKEDQKKVESARVAPTAIIVPTDTPVPSEEPSPTKKEEKKETKAPTPTTKEEKKTIDPVDKATGLDRSGLTVDILNGSGVSGAAGKMSSLLKDLGYVIGSTGNADNFDYQNVTIQVKSTKSKYLPLLKKDIGSSYSVGDASSSLASGSADVVIIVGK
ncbi:MAG: LytR C-terminal domain-containing protein [bacterium]|nr:LytR C-terminal domain-containing protein [bacterium]